MLSALNISALEIIAGIGWEPHIRGLLTVALSFAILGGSVWLLLVTNTGTRLGSLIAIAGFFGWMFVMGIFWWIYGIGWVGASPTWEVEDVFLDPAGAEVEGIGDAFVGNVDRLPDSNCDPGRTVFPPAGGVASVRVTSSTLCTPRAIEVLMAYPGDDRNSIMQELLNPQTPEAKIEALTAADPSLSRDALFDAQVAARSQEISDLVMSNNERSPLPAETAADLQQLVDERVGDADLRIDQISLTSLKGTAPQVIEWAEEQGLYNLGGWDLQSASQSGEATATADAYLREELFPEGNFVVLDAYQQGGKPKREGTGMGTRIAHKFTSTARITHPTNYTVVNVQQTLDKIADPSKPPPVPEADPEEPVYSVVMIRDLGNRRLIPALFTLATFALFLVSCYVLHTRDLALREKGLEV